MALDLDGGGIALEHNDDHLVAQPVADPAKPQMSAPGLGQPRTAMGSENGVGDLERSWSPDAEHRDGAAAFCREAAHERFTPTRLAFRCVPVVDSRRCPLPSRMSIPGVGGRPRPRV